MINDDIEYRNNALKPTKVYLLPEEGDRDISIEDLARQIDIDKAELARWKYRYDYPDADRINRFYYSIYNKEINRGKLINALSTMGLPLNELVVMDYETLKSEYRNRLANVETCPETIVLAKILLKVRKRIAVKHWREVQPIVDRLIRQKKI